MPELPEVEAARRAVQEHCVGKRINKCVVADDSKVIDGVSPSELQSSLVGKAIVAALRKGKNMWLQLDSPPFPSFQFGMTGSIYIKGVAVTKYKRSMVSSDEEWPSKFSKVFIELDDGLELSFTDKRRFARVRLLQDPASVPPISELGPDALTEPMKIDDFVKSLSKKKIAIKSLLLDQNYISGIGNWVADEVLYQARIHPLETALNLSKESCHLLHKCIREVLEKASDVGADSSNFPKNWIFHYREKGSQKAFVDGKKIDFITAGGRTSAFVPELQKLTGAHSGAVERKKAKKRSASADDDEEEENSEGEQDAHAAEANIKPMKKQNNKTASRGGAPELRKSTARAAKKQSAEVEEEAAAAAAKKPGTRKRK